MTQTPYQGRLVRDAEQRYHLCPLQESDPHFDILLQIGQWVSLWVGDRWISGPLVYSRAGEGYYVLEGPNWCPLQEGMVARCWQGGEHVHAETSS